MRAALLQAMARDPAGRFDTAQGFGNAIKNSVATLGGPASPAELARLLFSDFSDEMSSRDEILKAADDPNAAPISIGPSKPATPPPIPKREPQLAASGEMYQQTPPRSKTPTGNLEGVIIAQSTGSQTGKVALPDLANVLDLSEDVGADQWMAEGGTNLLASHRWKSLRNLILVLVGLGVVGVGVYMFFKMTAGDVNKKVVAAPPPDAAVMKKNTQPPPPDAPEVNKNDIIALSKFGFFTIDASAKTTIYVDNVRYGETPMQRLPLTPGPHKVKAVAKGKKPREFMITIIGGRDTEQETIDWDAPVKDAPK
jgi:hypothetical protein